MKIYTNPFRRVIETYRFPWARIWRSNLTMRFMDTFWIIAGKKTFCLFALTRVNLNPLDEYRVAGSDYFLLFIPQLIDALMYLIIKKFAGLPLDSGKGFILSLILTLVAIIHYGFRFFNFLVATIAMLLASPIILAVHCYYNSEFSGVPLIKEAALNTKGYIDNVKGEQTLRQFLKEGGIVMGLEDLTFDPHPKELEADKHFLRLYTYSAFRFFKISIDSFKISIDSEGQNNLLSLTALGFLNIGDAFDEHSAAEIIYELTKDLDLECSS